MASIARDTEESTCRFGRDNDFMRVPLHLEPRSIDKRQQAQRRVQRLTQFLSARPREEIMLWQWLNKRESYHAAQLMPDAPELIVPWLSIPVTAQPLTVSALNQQHQPSLEGVDALLADDTCITPASSAIPSPATVASSFPAMDDDGIPVVDSETWQQSLVAGSALYDMAHALDDTATAQVEDVIPSSFIPINEWKASPLDDDQAIYARLLEAHDYLSRQQAFRHRLAQGGEASAAATSSTGYDIVLTPGAPMRTVSVNAAGQVQMVKGNNSQQKPRKRRAKTDGDVGGSKPGPKPGKRQKKVPMPFKLWTEHEQLLVMQALMKDVRQRLGDGLISRHFDGYLERLMQRWTEQAGEHQTHTFELTLPHLFDAQEQASTNSMSTGMNLPPSIEENEKENKNLDSNAMEALDVNLAGETKTLTRLEEDVVPLKPEPTAECTSASLPDVCNDVDFRAHLQEFLQTPCFDAAMLRTWMTSSMFLVEQPALRECSSRNEATIDNLATHIRSMLDSESMQSCLTPEEMNEMRAAVDAGMKPYFECRQRGEDVLHRLELALHRAAVYARCMPRKKAAVGDK